MMPQRRNQRRKNMCEMKGKGRKKKALWPLPGLLPGTESSRAVVLPSQLAPATWHHCHQARPRPCEFILYKGSKDPELPLVTLASDYSSMRFAVSRMRTRRPPPIEMLVRKKLVTLTLIVPVGNSNRRRARCTGLPTAGMLWVRIRPHPVGDGHM
ncbi:hypothetical protein DM02DRAFT_386135 [Periconia macrospinosa]|uniref:Uncharacterized protein n=1 Tax=Periconia macrospinosa TaxID=97972 RepID=A0A2V1DV72_9PLEO|nr:hypothetical protein DM02DRAFT_386135 [Periconia macrospinosa]